MKLRKVELSEIQELEPLVAANLDSIEPGLQMIDRQLSIQDAGRPDILAVDEEGSAVIMELKNETSEVGHIDQAIRYYEWIRQNLAWLSRAFKKINPQNDPRIMLIAPDFDESVIRIAGYLNLNIELVKYTAVQDESSKHIGKENPGRP